MKKENKKEIQTMAEEFKIALVEPRIIQKVIVQAGTILAQGTLSTGIPLEKLILTLQTGKAKIIEVKKEEAKK